MIEGKTDNNNDKSVSMLAILGLLLAIIGSFGAWINLPIYGSAPTLIPELESYGQTLRVFRFLFLITVLLAGISSFLRYKKMAVSLAFSSLLIIVSFVISSLFYDHHLLVMYMEQSEERAALQGFITQYYWSNINPDHLVTLVGKYEHLWQRLILKWNVVGVGCKTAFIGALILFFSDIFTVRFSSGVLFIVTALIVTGALALAVPVIRADIAHHQGDTLSIIGKQRQALEAYNTAIELDPMLAYSVPFLIKASRLYHRIESGRSLLGGLYLLNMAITGTGSRQLSESFLEKLDNAQLVISELMSLDKKVKPLEPEATKLQLAIMRQSLKQSTSAWVSRGLLEYSNGLRLESLRSFQNALKENQSQVHVKYFIAHILMELKRSNESVILLSSAIQSVRSKQLRADFLCTIGNAYENLDKPLLARDAYTLCYELDPVYNYRAVRHLSGT